MRMRNLAVALAATMVVISMGLPLSASASVPPTGVSTVAQLTAAFTNGGSYILTQNIPADDQHDDYLQGDSKTTSIDLGGFSVTANDVQVGTSSTVVITDSTSPGGTFTVNDSFGAKPAIQVSSGMTLTVSGHAHLVATGRDASSPVASEPAIGATNIGAPGNSARNLGTVTITDDSVVTATGGDGDLSSGTDPGSAGIGGAIVGNGGSVVIAGNANVTATAGSALSTLRSGAGIGGGAGGAAGTVVIGGNSTVSATGKNGGAGIGSGAQADSVLWSSIGISGSAQVTAVGGGAQDVNGGGAGIGGGSGQSGLGSIGEAVSVSGSAVVHATGGPGAAGIGGGPYGDGHSLVTSGTAEVTAVNGSGATAVGIGSGGTNNGEVTIGSGTVLHIPSGSALAIPGAWGVTNNGEIEDSGAISTTGTGTIINNGFIRTNASGGLGGTVTTSVSNHNYSVAFNANGGGFRVHSGGTLTVYGTTLNQVGDNLPTASSISRSGYTFRGWVTNSNGLGTLFTEDTDLSGILPASTGSSSAITLYASWRANTSTTLSPADSSVAYGTADVLTATVGVGATGTVSFTLDSAPRPDGTLSGGSTTTTVLAGTPVGTHTVTATYSGDSTHAASTSSTTVTVTALPTSVTLTPANASVPYGTASTLTASTGAGTTGAIAFSLDGVDYSGGNVSGSQATVTLPATLSVGTHTIGVTYFGDATHSGSTTSTTETVTALGSTTTLSLSAGSVVAGIAVNVSASVTSGATGSVSFALDGTPLSTAPLTSGVATAVVPARAGAGTHILTASYSGDSIYSGSTTSASLVITAESASTTGTTGTTRTVGTTSTSVSAKVALVISGKKFAKHHKPKVRVSFGKLANGQKVTGKIALYVGSTKVTTVKISKKTALSVTLPKAYAKSIRVTAVFLGSSAIPKTTSKVATIKAK